MTAATQPEWTLTGREDREREIIGDKFGRRDKESSPGGGHQSAPDSASLNECRRNGEDESPTRGTESS